MSKFYDVTKEHTKIEKSTGKKTGRHPNKGIKGKNPYSGVSKS